MLFFFLFVDMTDEKLSDEEELDFYDFLEVVTDKIDDITTQSISNERKQTK